MSGYTFPSWIACKNGCVPLLERGIILVQVVSSMFSGIWDDVLFYVCYDICLEFLFIQLFYTTIVTPLELFLERILKEILGSDTVLARKYLDTMAALGLCFV